jgi:biotin--protein ligase
LDPSKAGSKEYVKIGGILVNSSYSSGNYDLVVGIGLNTANAAPTTSLNSLLPSNLAPFTLEKLLARILTKFETMYNSFCRTGFDKGLEGLYYRHWLHTDQIVTLEQEGGARVRIKGITTDWGLLRAEELGWEDKPTGKVWELQSDSNSFDFFRGLLKRKV